MARPVLGSLLLLAACSGGGTAAANPDPGPAGGGGPAPEVPAHVLLLEEDAWARINDERAGQALSSLLHDELLRSVARAHSRDMADRAFFAHENPDGLDPFDRLTLAGATFATAAENIAWNQGFPDPAAAAVDGWMSSPGHRANILDDRFTHTGLGVAEGPSGDFYFTQVFVRPAGAVVLLGWTGVGETGLDTPLLCTSCWRIGARPPRTER